MRFQEFLFFGEGSAVARFKESGEDQYVSVPVKLAPSVSATLMAAISQATVSYLFPGMAPPEPALPGSESAPTEVGAGEHALRTSPRLPPEDLSSAVQPAWFWEQIKEIDNDAVGMDLTFENAAEILFGLFDPEKLRGVAAGREISCAVLNDGMEIAHAVLTADRWVEDGRSFVPFLRRGLGLE